MSSRPHCRWRLRPIPVKVVLVMLVFFAASCGSDPDECSCIGDARPWDDGPDEDGFCDPVAQTGCDTGEKCTWQEVTDSLGRIACVPVGLVTIGGACQFLPPGETAGYDDCVPGAYCLDAVCSEICSSRLNK